MEKITIGTDPEVFLFNNTTNSYKSAVGLIGGTKEKPMKITIDGHTLQEDNVMVEIGIPPCDNSNSFKSNIKFVLEHIKKMIPPELSIKIDASAVFNESELLSKKAQEFGCDPDFNAWTFEINHVGKANPLLRTAGGHIHCGYPNPTIDKSIRIIKAMDLFLGVPSILIDKDTLRREVYGKSGAFRPQPWGCEYRVLSNFWLRSDELMEWAFNNTILSYKESENIEAILSEQDIIDIRECINNCDKDLAKKLINKFHIPMVDITSPCETKIKLFNNLNNE